MTPAHVPLRFLPVQPSQPDTREPLRFLPVCGRRRAWSRFSSAEREAVVLETLAALKSRTGVTRDLMLSATMDRTVVDARRDVSVLLDATGMFSSIAIGRVVGLDHSTVLYHLGRLKKRQPPRAPDPASFPLFATAEAHP